MKRIAPLDAVFLNVERHATPSVIAGLFVLDPETSNGGTVRHKDILQYVEDRLHLSPSLRRRLVFNPLGLDEPRMMDDENFDLEFHVRHIALPQPCDRRQFAILCARIFSRPMDHNRPLWEMYVIEGLSNVEGYSKDCFAILFKLHHTAFDGIAAATTIFSMLVRNPEGTVVKPTRRWVPERKPRMLEWVSQTYMEGLKQSYQNVRALPNVAKGLGQLISGSRNTDDRVEIPETRFQGEVSSHRVWDWVSIPMGQLLTARDGLGKPKINDMCVAIVAGAVRRYLDHKGELPEETLYGVCPINVRGKGNPLEGGNHVSFMRLALGTNIADPIERIRLITQGTQDGKAASEKYGASFIGDLLGLFPYPTRRFVLKSSSHLTREGVIKPASNTVVTNVPNPRGDYYFAGAQLKSYTGMGPVYDGYGLFHTVTSMEWELTISATSCREMMPDIGFYMDCLRDSVRDYIPNYGEDSVKPQAELKLAKN